MMIRRIASPLIPYDESFNVVNKETEKQRKDKYRQQLEEPSCILILKLSSNILDYYCDIFK